MKNPPKQEILYQNRGFVPLSEYNSINENGYFGEIDAFVQQVEKGNSTNVLTNLTETKKVFELIEKIKSL